MVVVMLTATFFVIRQIPSLYESRALIVVNLRSDDQGGSQNGRFSALQQELTSRVTLATLVRKHGLYPKAKDTEEAMGSLQKAVKPETKMRGYYPETPESISISFRYADPTKTRDVVADLVGIFETANEQMKIEAATEAERIAAQTAEIEARLKQLGSQRDIDAMRINALTSARNDASSQQNRREIVEASVEALSDKEYLLERQIEEQRKQIAEQEKTIKSLPSPNSATGTAAYGQLVAEKTTIEADIKVYSEQYTEKNPKMVQLRARLNEINRQIARLESGVAGAPAPVSQDVRELRVMQRELARLEADLDIVRRELSRKRVTLGKIPAGGALRPPERRASVGSSSAATAARAEYDRLYSRYNILIERQDNLLKLSGARGPAETMFQVIDAPNLPHLPVAPNRMLLRLIALGLALGFGLIIALAVELPRMFMINDDRDIEYFLGAPVLALIPETLTPLERSRRRKVQMTRSLLVMMLAAALVPAFIVLLIRLQIFQILGSR
jgi:uncharacterized protein involved in exopolysaccharide biosynthesis